MYVCLGKQRGSLCVAEAYTWIAMWINGSLECGWRPLVSPTNYSTALDGIPRCNRSPTKLCRDGRSTYHLHPAFGLSNAIFSPRVLKLLLISAWLDWKWSYISQLTRIENEKDQKKYQTLIMTVPLFAQKIFWELAIFLCHRLYFTRLFFHRKIMSFMWSLSLYQGNEDRQ